VRQGERALPTQNRRFIKFCISRNDEFLSRQTEEAMAFCVRFNAQVDAWQSAIREFVRFGAVVFLDEHMCWTAEDSN
jgi:hypothetical protein